MVAEGHDVGLHGLDHQRLTRLSRSAVSEHVKKGATRLAAITGGKPRYFRPPYGSQNFASFRAVRKQGMESVVWSADCDDWSQHPETHIAKKAVDAASPGAVLLLHDTLAADPLDPAVHPNIDRKLMVELVLEGLAARGLRSASMTQLLEQGDAHRTMWFRA